MGAQAPAKSLVMLLMQKGLAPATEHSCSSCLLSVPAMTTLLYLSKDGTLSHSLCSSFMAAGLRMSGRMDRACTRQGQQDHR
jgi:hypothetical protein